MAFCNISSNRLVTFLLICFALAYLPGLPPHVTFTAYSNTPPRELEGVLKVNEKLNGAQHILVGQIKNAEGFAVANNTLYTGIEGGEVVKIIGDKMVTVAKISHYPCVDSWDERNCGRLLGMQFDKHGMLYVVDGYYGIYKVNVNTGNVMHLISTDKPIEGKMAKLANSVEVAKDGTVYWTVSSCEMTGEQVIPAMLADPSGRLLKYDPIKKTNSVLMDNFHFANGLALSSKEDFIVVAETVRARLWRYWLTGPKKGTSEIFVDGLPGLPDNMHSNSKGGFIVTLIQARSSSIPILTDLLGPYPAIRRFIVRLLYFVSLPFEVIHGAMPNIYTGIITHWVNNMELVVPVLPKKVIVLEINESGEIIDSLQSTDKRVTIVSDFAEVDNFYYLGSPVNNFLGRVIAPAKSTRT